MASLFHDRCSGSLECTSGTQTPCFGLTSVTVLFLLQIRELRAQLRTQLRQHQQQQQQAEAPSLQAVLSSRPDLAQPPTRGVTAGLPRSLGNEWSLPESVRIQGYSNKPARPRTFVYHEPKFGKIEMTVEVGCYMGRGEARLQVQVRHTDFEQYCMGTL